MTINYQKADFLTSYFDVEKITAPLKPEILFIGRSNVGKSSMINKLLNRKNLARTSGTPGKTIAVNFYDIDDKIYFVDLPGYGFAQRSKAERQNWGKLIGSYLDSKRDIRLIVFIVDIRHKPSEDDFLMYDYLMKSEFLFCVAAAKADKLSPKEIKEQVDALSGIFKVKAIPFSIITGSGVEEIKQIINDVSKNNDEV